MENESKIKFVVAATAKEYFGLSTSALGEYMFINVSAELRTKMKNKREVCFLLLQPIDNSVQN